jgi:hypothetical protein
MVGGRPVRQTVQLRENERDGNYTVDKISPEPGRVVLSHGEAKETLDLDPATGPVAKAPTLQLRSVRLDQIIILLQTLAGRTIISSPSSRNGSLDLTTPPLGSRSKAVEALENALAAEGLVLKHASDKFTLLAGSSESNVVESIPKVPQTVDPAKAASASSDVIPAGMISFTDTDLQQVLAIYQDITDRAVIRGNAGGKIMVRSGTSVNRSELTWMLDTVIRLTGVIMIPESNKFVFALAPSQTNALPRFNREKALGKAMKGLDWQPRPLKLVNADFQLLIELYAAVLGRKTIPRQDGLPNRYLYFNSQTPLDQAETVYALEALAWVNNVAFELVPPDKVQMISLPSAQ